MFEQVKSKEASLSMAEQARTLVVSRNVATLATQSRRFEGWPFSTLVNYAVDSDGRPLLLLSSMAVHTQNLFADGRASLLIAENYGQPLTNARVTLVGNITVLTQAERSECEQVYLARNPDAEMWMEFRDFAMYRMEIESAYFVGGFGVMGWVQGSEYKTAQPDPLHAAAAELMAQWNDRHQDLLLIAMVFAGESATSCHLVAIDRLGFRLRMEIGERISFCRLSFENEVRSCEDAHNCLEKLAAKAASAA